LQELPISSFYKSLWPSGWRERTCLMGIINVTPDSFSDGGKYFDPLSAQRRASKLIDEGADVIDIGAQSTRPMSEELEIEEELRRLKPALISIRKAHPDSIISVDTFNSEVADLALSIGANWINDISGGRRDPHILKIVAESRCPFVLTHSRGTSQTMDQLTSYKDVTNDVYLGLLRRTDEALKAGVKPEQIIWDPGLGFAKTTEQNLILLNEIETLSSKEFPILLGPSRKRFIGSVLKKSNLNSRIWGTAAIACRSASTNISMLRVHDVGPIYQTLQMAMAISKY